MNKKAISFSIPKNKQNKIIFGAILAIVLFLYYFLYINKMLPSSEGWGEYYVELIKSGKFPYRDFYFYLPPLNLVVDFIFYSITKSILGYRILRLIERILMMELLYSMLCKKYHPSRASLGCIIGGIIGSFSTYDLMGDYNQTGVFLILILGYFALRFIENIDNNKKYKFIFGAGISIGLLFTIKQTVFVAACISFFLVLLFYCFIEKDKAFKFYVLYTIIGVLIPISVCFICLLANNAFFPFIEQVFMGSDSKGGLFDILVGNISYYLFGKDNHGYLFNFIILVFFFSMLTFLLKYRNMLIQQSLIRKVAICFLIICSFWILYSQRISLQNITLAGKETKLLIPYILLFLPFCLFFCKVKKNTFSTNLLITLLYLLPNAFFIYYILSNRNNVTPLISQKLVGTTLTDELGRINIFFSFFYIIYLFIQRIKKGNWEDKKYHLIISLTCFCNNYSAVMASGATSVPARLLFLFIPYIFCFLLSFKTPLNKVKNLCIYLFASIIILFSFAEKVESPYSWWGWAEEPLYNKTETTDIDFAQGFLFSEDEKEIYEKITKLITENTSENDTVYTFPHHKLFNLLSNRLEMETFVPVPFYDVCSDKYASLDAEILKESPPKIVVWCDMLDCMNVHEMFFRGGNRSGQRDIQEWLYEKTEDETYICIGQIENLFVFYLNDGQDPNYTYFENKNTICHTLLEKNLRPDIEIKLAGSGTKEDPYQINDLQDFINFRNYVNNGYSFSEEFVSLNCNIDLSSIRNWIPIGEFDSGRYFYGSFNGNGFTISNLSIRGNNNSGLFGQLGGNVYNLSISNFYIEGACVGGIASHAVGTPSIINCSATGTAIGLSRAGGIADNFSGGTISCCYSNCQLEGSDTGAIISYNASSISNCVTTTPNMYSSFFTGTQANNTVLLSSQESIEKLNHNLDILLSKSQQQSFHLWTLDDDKIVLSLNQTISYKSDYLYLLPCIIAATISIYIYARYYYKHATKKSFSLKLIKQKIFQKYST